jgi:hypothetical protein
MSIERLALLLLATVALVGFVVSPALGGPGFLTTKKANKVFLKKRVANTRFLTKNEAGTLFYSRGEADSRFLRPEGEIRINAGPTNWVVGAAFEGPAPTATYFADAVRLRSTAEAAAFAQLAPEIPVNLYGRPVKIVGAELCYDAGANAELEAVILDMVSESNGIGEPPPITEVVRDQTSRTDNACRSYRAPSPVPLDPNGHLLLAVLVHYPTSSVSDFLIGRTTFLLQP